MIVIAGTSPLNYLVRIGHVEILPRLYERIVIPPSVLAELRSPGAPEVVRHWVKEPAVWLKVQAPTLKPDLPLLDAGWDPANRRLKAKRNME